MSGRGGRPPVPLRPRADRPDVLLAGLHGDGHAHPAAARRHQGDLGPRVRLGVVALHAVQERVAVVAACQEEGWKPWQPLFPMFDRLEDKG